MTSPRPRFIALLALGLMSRGAAPKATAAYIDSINPNATVIANTYYSTVDNGWYYTPTQTYSLTGISSYFSPITGATGSQTITVQIQTDRPAAGGTLLDQGTFTGQPAVGGIIGATFSSPVTLVAGTTYFVDFLNVAGMGVNLGQWTTDASGNHVASGGATTRLSAYYRDSGSNPQFATAYTGTGLDQANPNGTFTDVEPILFFGGTPLVSTVPEPSSVLMLAVGLGGLAWKCRGRFGR